VAVSSAWIVLAEFVIRPRGADFPVAWPAALLAAMTASLQAISGRRLRSAISAWRWW